MGGDYDPESGNDNPALLACIVAIDAPNEGVAVREIVRMLRDAADGAGDMHIDQKIECAKLRRFSELMTAALRVIA